MLRFAVAVPSRGVRKVLVVLVRVLFVVQYGAAAAKHLRPLHWIIQ